MTQFECLEYLKKHQGERVLCSDICKHYNLNNNTVNRALRQLVKFKMVEYTVIQIGTHNYYSYKFVGENDTQ